MEVKHQVFVSSTYKDLVDERKAVTHALLELDCIPAGMELFPATDEDAWTLIKEVIDGCDYYILIIGGKYGSSNENGVGFTEMEFDYAASVGKPILAFIHENPESLPAANVERSDAAQKKLADFREKAKTKHCKFWNSADDLGGKVSRSLVQLRKRHPSPGWIPGKFAASDSLLRELQELRAKVSQYELAADLGCGGPPEGNEQLVQGKDPIVFSTELKHDKSGPEKRTKLTTDWDTLFSYFGPSMLSECTDEEMMSKVRLALFHAIPKDIREFTSRAELIVLPYVFADRLRVQFQALGLIAPGIKRRAVSDTSKYWRLTPYGEKTLLQLKAQRRPIASS